MSKVPLLDLKAQYATISEEIDSAVKEVIQSGIFILGENAKRLEEEIASSCNTKYAIGVASGTDALLLSLMACNIGRGDEVITSPFTFIATAEVIVLLGAKPVFVDIDSKTYNIDPDKIKEAITPKTKAIIPVHLYGQPADMDKILTCAGEHNLVVIEDAAQAIGAKYKNKRVGEMGKTCGFSFFPAKNLGAYGDGGMITTNDEELAKKLKMLRTHGSQVKYHHELIGTNSRLDELQSAILRVKLKRLNEWTNNRQRIAQTYTQAFMGKEIITPFVEEFNFAVYNQYTIRVKNRDELIAHLKKSGVDTAIHYPIPLHLQPAFSYLGYKAGDFIESEQASKEVLSLPVYPELTDEQIETVISAVLNW
ncbi:MAG: DegT/DnrJ/EryC1/StrS family aminotransferase [Nitrospirota bacterium]